MVSVVAQLANPGELFDKEGKAALVPGYGGRADLTLPESSTEWTMAQPDTVLKVSQAFLQANLSTYSLGHSRYWADLWQFALVKTQLNNMMQSLIPAVDDKLQYIVLKVLGTDTGSWKEINLDESIRMIVAGLSGRSTVRLPLYCNKDYLKRTLSIIDCVTSTAIIGNCIPLILLPIAACLSSLHTWSNLIKIKNHITPQYHERMAALEKDTDDQPQDQLQVMLRFVQKKRSQEDNEIGIIATSLAASNFEFNTIAKLREEAKQELDSDSWAKEEFMRMNSHNSVARESMRVTFPFSNRGLLHKVMKEDDITDSGIPLKKGTIVAFLASQAQRDPAKFPESDKLDLWRFSCMVEKE
ncbi:cytochrome P450 [Aspergillus alliaceus]|uniref:cytochrome P450 n=1 Tax=Petromyces alliaceus TaxID=209559 RepID=UPI0012A649B5|nr:cytochrome P450 [Aspergillus alliaceus]KAB8237581.1 cytochrome P450 [Aspergillus alliaceus]